MDVKPGNIFLDEEFNARLGDAGMSQELPIDHSYASTSQMRGTEGYKDVYCHDLHLKPINDIFSFGVGRLQDCFVFNYHKVIFLLAAQWIKSA